MIKFIRMFRLIHHHWFTFGTQYSQNKGLSWCMHVSSSKRVLLRHASCTDTRCVLHNLYDHSIAGRTSVTQKLKVAQNFNKSVVVANGMTAVYHQKGRWIREPNLFQGVKQLIHCIIAGITEQTMTPATKIHLGRPTPRCRISGGKPKKRWEICPV